MFEFMQTFLQRFLTPIDDPSSRLFYMNILASMGFVLIYIFIQWGLNPSLFTKKFNHLVLNKRYWWNRSSKFDYQVYTFNGLLKVFLLVPVVEFSFEFSRFFVKFLIRTFGDFQGFEETLPYLLLFTIVAFIYDDFLRFINHYVFHKVPFLWRFHKIHHSAKVITPITLYRTHPVELLAATMRNSLSLGGSIGLYIYLFEAPYNVFNFMGVNLFAFTFNLLASHLRHSHIPLSFGWLEYIFISPKQHQIHHSKDPMHYDKNFGVSLSIWDALFGARIFSWQAKKKLSYGVNGLYKHGFFYQLLSPFRRQSH